MKRRKKRGKVVTNRPVAASVRGERFTLRIAPAVQKLLRDAAKDAGVSSTNIILAWLYRGLISEKPALRDLRGCKNCGNVFSDPGGKAEECPKCQSRRLKWLLEVGKERPRV